MIREVVAEFCESCTKRIEESKIERCIAETIVVQEVLKLPSLERVGTAGCWGCGLSHVQFSDALREAGRLEALATSYGGTYTSETVAIHLGEADPDVSATVPRRLNAYAIPTDKESSQK